MSSKEPLGQNSIILDYIDDIRVDGDPFAEPANEYAALLALKEGMHYLNGFAERCDKVMISRLDPTKRYILSGNAPEFAGLPLRLLTCAFHWYSISACQYVKTVGAIACRNDTNRELPHEYIKSVIPEVLAFRDKVAAHFAWNTQHSQDNDAERLASIMPPVSFDGDSFHVGTFKIIMRSSGVASNSGAIQQWSITKIHKRLCERYWPEYLEEQPEPALYAQISMVQECVDKYEITTNTDGSSHISIDIPKRFSDLWLMKISDLITSNKEIEYYKDNS